MLVAEVRASSGQVGRLEVLVVAVEEVQGQLGAEPTLERLGRQILAVAAAVASTQAWAAMAAPVLSSFAA
jgi:hypothetical protein